jgi:type IV secretory pathway TrbF-like protein
MTQINHSCSNVLIEVVDHFLNFVTILRSLATDNKIFTITSVNSAYCYIVKKNVIANHL